MTSYPFKAGRLFDKRNLLDRLKTYYDTMRVTARERRHKHDVEVNAMRQVTPLGQSDVPLVFITHNDMTLLPYFLQHYRSLGVTRFICIDDVSSDGTREFLLEQQDVDVWTSPKRYAEARRGRSWREQIFAYYGYGRWYVNVDSDEFLVYDRCFERPVNELSSALERIGINRLPAPMLDMYSGAVESQGEKKMPWHFSGYFDGSGYHLTTHKRGISLKGGPRRRKFGEDNELMKYPLIFWDENCFFGSSPHRPLPYDRNFQAVWGVLLHFKFFTNYKEKIAEAAVGRQHYNASQYYQTMMSELSRAGEIDLMADTSVLFQGPQQLVDLGFMTSIDYSADGGRGQPA